MTINFFDILLHLRNPVSLILIYGSREDDGASFLKIKSSLIMETKSASVAKDHYFLLTINKDCLFSPSNMLSHPSNAILLSKKGLYKTHFKLLKFSSAHSIKKTKHFSFFK